VGKKHKWIDGKKICPSCGIEKPKEEYVKHASTKSGYSSYCKICHNKRIIRYRETPGGKYKSKETNKKYRSSEKGKEIRRIYQKSKKGKRIQRKGFLKWQKSEKGKIWKKKYWKSYKIKKTEAALGCMTPTPSQNGVKRNIVYLKPLKISQKSSWINGHKPCPSCGINQPKENYPPNSSEPSGVSCYCKNCTKKSRIAYRKTPKAKYLKKIRNIKREKGLGFIPLNKPFPGSVAHHVDNQHVVHIPELIHIMGNNGTREQHRQIILEYYGSLENMIKNT